MKERAASIAPTLPLPGLVSICSLSCLLPAALFLCISFTSSFVSSPSTVACNCNGNE